MSKWVGDNALDPEQNLILRPRLLFKDEADVMEVYDALANSYVVKPVDLDDFIAAVKGILDFWMRIARIPRS